MKGPPQAIIYKAWVCLLQGRGRLTSHTPGIRLADLPLSTQDREKNWRETSGFRKGAATVPRPAQTPTGKGPWISNGLNVPSRRWLALSPFADIPYKRAAHRMKVPPFQRAVGWTTRDRSWEDRRDGVKMSHKQWTMEGRGSCDIPKGSGICGWRRGSHERMSSFLLQVSQAKHLTWKEREGKFWIRYEPSLINRMGLSFNSWK